MPSRDWRKVFARFLAAKEDRNGETKAYCPSHEDPESSKTPSASFNFGKGAFKCFGGCPDMSINELYLIAKDDATLPAPTRQSGAAQRKAAKSKPLPTEDTVEAWHQKLIKSTILLTPLKDARGLNDATIDRFQIGYHGDRYMIPVRDKAGDLINIRRYKLGAREQKMWNWPDHGSPASLFPVEALDKDTILLCEGELDALVATEHGFAAISGTAGAGTWLSEWSRLFKGKEVFIVYDNDKMGESGARKAADSLRQVCAVHIVKLPVDEKQDLTDYFVHQGGSAEALHALMDRTPLSEEIRLSRKNTQPARRATVAESLDGANADVPLELIAMVGGKTEGAPYHLPRKVQANCGMEWGAKCKACKMDRCGGQYDFTIERDETVLLKLIDRPQAEGEKEIKKDREIQPNCPHLQFQVVDKYSVEELVVVPNADDPGADANMQHRQTVFNVGEFQTEVNQTVRFTGATVTDPRDHRAVFQAWASEPTKTNLDRFEMTPEMHQRLRIFQPKESVRAKLNTIARDIAANVTKIYDRTMLHIAYDLVWHSVLGFDFNGARVSKGWLELLAIGDTRTGKSEAASRLCTHYQAGVLKSCEGATLAGLMGAAQQTGKRWMVTWGTIPLQDRRLVVLDEVSGIRDKNILEQMSALRSSGRAQITKVASAETNARTRLIWISNPADTDPVAGRSRGAIAAIEGLIPQPEDVARFDFAIAVSSDEVNGNTINTTDPPKVRHRYTTELCSALVMWAWSRKPEDVVWAEGVEHFITEQARDLGGRYVEEPPLIQQANIRIKLARLSAAVAARVYSSPDGQRLVVEEQHVIAAVQILDDLYGSKSFGYADFSRRQIREKLEAKRFRKSARRWLVHHPHVVSTLAAVMGNNEFRPRDFEEFGGLNRDEVQDAIKELLRMRMVFRQSRGYVKMRPDLIELVNELEER